MIQIIIKAYDETLHRFNVPKADADAIIQQLTDREEELAAHEYLASLKEER